METGQTVINNQLISYLKNGTISEECLLFLHGWRSNKEVWNNVIQKLFGRNNQVLVYSVDLPGFGQSSTPPTAWSVGDYAGLVKQFIEKFELKNVIIIGHSFGGRVAIKLASNYPELIFKLVLVDSAGITLSSNKKNLMLFFAKLVKPLFRPRFMEGLRKKIYRQIGAEDYLATPTLQKTFVNIIKEDLTPDMKQITVPTLLIWGENDTETPVSFGEKMHSLILNSKFTILTDAGHFSFLDKPENFVKSLNEFI